MKRIIWPCLIMSIAVMVGAQDSGGTFTLGDCVEMALNTHPSIKAAEMGRRSAVYRKRSTLAGALVSLKAEYSHTWLDEQPTFSIPGQPDTTISGAMPNPTPPPATIPLTFNVPGSPPQSLPAGEDEIDSLTITATQPIFTGGAMWHGWSLAKLQERDAILQLDTARLEISFQTHRSFYGVLKAEEFVVVTTQAVEMAERLLKRARDFYDVGMIARNQLLEAEVGLAEQIQNATTAQSGHAIAQSVLNLLVGRYEARGIGVRGELEIIPVNMSMEECILFGYDQRPELLSARIGVQMAYRMVKLERAGWFPQVALIGRYTHEVGGFNSDEDVLSITLGARWDFWEWGRKYYNVRSATEMAHQAEQALRHIEGQIVVEIQNDYFRLKEAEANIRTARIGLKSALENLRVMEARFDQNMATSFDMITAQTFLTKARTAEISALADYMTAKAALERAMGVMPGSQYEPLSSPERKTEPNPGDANEPEPETVPEISEEENEENP